MIKKQNKPDILFSSRLLKWNRDENTRQMPWKGEKDPYKIWLSEIILQQTRVDQGLKYYNNFISTFPDVHALANAPESTVIKLWEGLGYYTRCRNLITTARFISSKMKGKFPADYDEIRSLKGVGPYTAAAIASFAYNLPYAVVDGNVFRVLSRVFGIAIPIDSAKGKKYFSALAEELLDKRNPGIYNQAIMDFGALICKPAAPLCSGCVFGKDCKAFKNNKTSKLPVKEKKIVIRKRWFNFLVIDCKGHVAIRQRSKKDIWQGLYEFPLVETPGDASKAVVLETAEKNKWLSKKKYELTEMSASYRQKLSHQQITGRFLLIEIRSKPQLLTDFLWVKKNSLHLYAFPQIINQYLKKKSARAVLK